MKDIYNLFYILEYTLVIIIIIIIIKKRLEMRGREREIDTRSIRRPQPHTTNL